jgi:hypothetical protein
MCNGAEISLTEGFNTLQYHDKLDEDSYYIFQSLSSGKMNKSKAFWKIVIQFMIHSENISADLKAKYSQL